MSKVILVIGMHRSGTSVIASMLQELGVNMGSDLLEADSGNPLGYFEEDKIWKINEDVLNHAGGDWAFPPSRFMIIVKGREMEQKMIDYINNDTPKQGDWGWKDPRTSLLLDFYIKHLPNLHLVVCRRSCRDIARSLTERDGSHEESNTLLCEEYNNRIDEFLSKNKVPYIQVDYDETIKSPKKIAKRLNKFAKLKASSESINNAASKPMNRSEITKLKSQMKKEESKSE